MNGYREQRPTTATNWLYQDRENEREFCKVVCHADGDPDWAECTDAEKEEWEAAHPQPIPETEGENA